MFFSHFVLAKKGPLARIWLAAHWDKKLTKAHILEINIERSVEGILQPKIKLALRTSGHLLLGVVRIYSRKAKYLLAECNEAFVKIKMAFRPGMVDLPEGNREAALATITLPEVFHDFENINDIRIEVNASTTLHQSRAEDITLKEDYGTLSLIGDDTFADMGFDDPEMARDATNIDEGFDQTGLLLPDEDEQPPAEEGMANNISEAVNPSESTLIPNGSIEKDFVEAENANAATPGLFESGLFEDAPLTAVPHLETSDGGSGNDAPFVPCPPNDVEMSDDDTYGGPPSVGLPSSPESVVGNMDEATEIEPHVEMNPQPEVVEDAIQLPIADEAFNQPESESFALGPLETVTHKGPERAKSKRKRKLIIDEVKNISGEEMKAQLSDTRDIISTLDLAPPTKRLMHWKESGGVEKLFALPGRSLQSKTLSRLYMRHLTTRPMNDETFEVDDHHNMIEDMKCKDPPQENLRSSKRLRQIGPEAELEVPVPAPLEEPLVQPSVNGEPNSTDNAFEQLLIPPVVNGDITQDQSLVEEANSSKPEETVQAEVPPEPEEKTQVQTETEAEPAPEAEKNEIEGPKEPTAAESLFDQIASTHQTSVNAVDVNVEQPQDNFLALDDDDDYHNPASIGPPEEQMYDETYEQFEERIHGKRATHMLQVMKRNLDAGNKIPFSALTRGSMRKQVAQKFYTLLVLKKQLAVELEQSSPYDEIYITKGPQLDGINP